MSDGIYNIVSGLALMWHSAATSPSGDPCWHYGITGTNWYLALALPRKP